MHEGLVLVDLVAEKRNHVLKLCFVFLIGGDEVFVRFEDFPGIGDFLIIELGKFGFSVAITAQHMENRILIHSATIDDAISRVETFGLVVHDVPRDNHCFFHGLKWWLLKHLGEAGARCACYVVHLCVSLTKYTKIQSQRQCVSM